MEATLSKVSVKLPEEDIAVLKRLAADRCCTLTQVMRQAIATELFFSEEQAKGGTVLLRTGKRLREVVFK